MNANALQKQLVKLQKAKCMRIMTKHTTMHMHAGKKRTNIPLENEQIVRT